MYILVDFKNGIVQAGSSQIRSCDDFIYERIESILGSKGYNQPLTHLWIVHFGKNLKWPNQRCFVRISWKKKLSINFFFDSLPEKCESNSQYALWSLETWDHIGILPMTFRDHFFISAQQACVRIDNKQEQRLVGIYQPFFLDKGKFVITELNPVRESDNVSQPHRLKKTIFFVSVFGIIFTLHFYDQLKFQRQKPLQIQKQENSQFVSESLPHTPQVKSNFENNVTKDSQNSDSAPQKMLRPVESPKMHLLKKENHIDPMRCSPIVENTVIPVRSNQKIYGVEKGKWYVCR